MASSNHPAFDPNGSWSPRYTVHKIMAGLYGCLPAYRQCTGADGGDQMADWTALSPKTRMKTSWNKCANCEYGGMNDILVHLYELTGTKAYLDLSYKFHDKFILEQLSLTRWTPCRETFPPAIGCARRHEHTGAGE